MAKKIDIAKYARDCLEKREEHKTTNIPGPVVTISREFGCPAKLIASELNEAINKEKVSGKWCWVSKEILNESAEHLGLHPDEIKYIFDYKKKGIVEEIISSHSKKYYHSDRKIRNSIGKVIKKIATTGNVIIVGRGGAAITTDIQRSLHIKLLADIKWRAKKVGRRRNINIAEAIKLTEDFDKKRKKFLDYYWGDISNNSLFDIVFNCEKMSSKEIVSSVITLLKERGII